MDTLAKPQKGDTDQIDQEYRGGYCTLNLLFPLYLKQKIDRPGRLPVALPRWGRVLEEQGTGLAFRAFTEKT